MDSTAAAPFNTPSRPVWHPDAKWVCALLLVLVWTATCLAYTAYLASEEEFTVEALSVAVDSVLRADGRIDDGALDRLRQELDDPEAVIRPLPDFDVTVTGAQMQAMTSAQLSRHILAELVTVLYRQGPEALSERILDPGMRAALDDESGQLNAFTHETHALAGRILAGLAAASILLTGLLVLFSYGFGRFISPGLVLALATLPWFFLAVGGRAGLGDGAVPAVTADSEMEFSDLLRAVGAEVLPALLENLALGVGIVMLLAVTVLLVGIAGSLKGLWHKA